MLMISCLCGGKCCDRLPYPSIGLSLLLEVLLPLSFFPFSNLFVFPPVVLNVVVVSSSFFPSPWFLLFVAPLPHHLPEA